MKRWLEYAILTAELAGAGYFLWRQTHPDAAGLDELADRFWSSVQERARYREAIRQTLASIRSLPETGE